MTIFLLGNIYVLKSGKTRTRVDESVNSLRAILQKTQTLRQRKRVSGEHHAKQDFKKFQFLVNFGRLSSALRPDF